MILWGLGILGSTVKKVKTGKANNFERPPRQSGRSLLEKARGYKETITTTQTTTENRPPRTPYQVVIVCIGVFFLFIGLAGMT